VEHAAHLRLVGDEELVLPTALVAPHDHVVEARRFLLRLFIPRGLVDYIDQDLFDLVADLSGPNFRGGLFSDRGVRWSLREKAVFYDLAAGGGLLELPHLGADCVLAQLVAAFNASLVQPVLCVSVEAALDLNGLQGGGAHEVARRFLAGGLHCDLLLVRKGASLAYCLEGREKIRGVE
jgi:hypothetical protein